MRESATETKPSVARYERIQIILESDPTLRSQLGPRKQKILKRNGEAALFSRGAVIVTEELQRRGIDQFTVSRALVQGIGTQLLGLVQEAPAPAPSEKSAKTPKALPKVKTKPKAEPKPKVEPKLGVPPPEPKPEAPKPEVKVARPKPVRKPVAASPAPVDVATAEAVAAASTAAAMPTFCPFVSIASLLHSTYNLLKLCDREPGAEKRLESVTLLLAETIKLKDVALAVPVESLPVSLQRGGVPAEG